MVSFYLRLSSLLKVRRLLGREAGRIVLQSSAEVYRVRPFKNRGQKHQLRSDRKSLVGFIREETLLTRARRRFREKIIANELAVESLDSPI